MRRDIIFDTLKIWWASQNVIQVHALAYFVKILPKMCYDIWYRRVSLEKLFDDIVKN
jgi:hypothetical protein